MSARNRPTRRTHTGAQKAGVSLLQQVATLLLALVGFLYSLLTSYRLTVDGEILLLGTILAYGALFFVVFSSKRRGVLLPICLGLMVLFVAWRAAALLQGMLLLVTEVLRPLSLRLPDALKDMLTVHDAEETARLTALALRTLMLPTALLAAYCVVLRPRIGGLIFATLPLLAPAPFYGYAPAPAPFFCLVSSYLMLYIRNAGRFMPAAAAERGGETMLRCREMELTSLRSAQQLLSLLALPLFAMAALLAGLLLPSKGYVRPARIAALRQSILDLDLGRLSGRGNDGLTHGDLTNLASIRFTGDTALKVRVSAERALYLRDFAGARYTQTGWENVPDATYADSEPLFQGVAPQRFYALAAEACAVNKETYTLAVQNVAAPQTSLWMPGGLITDASEIDGAAYVQDTAISADKASGISAYMLTAYPCDAALFNVPFSGGQADAASLRSTYKSAAGGSFGLQSAAGAEAERVRSAADAYVDYTFDTYTDLPEETRLAAEALCASYGLTLHIQDGAVGLYDTCRNLYMLLTTRCSYAYSPPMIPANADFTTYFLEQSRRGYCVHFATAATVLLRSLGIPARYAEGYIVVRGDYAKQTDADGFLAIEDTHAHAWVEVFDPMQMEWIPVEMTPSSSGDTAPDAEESMPLPTPTLIPTPTSEPTAEPTPSFAAESTPDPAQPEETDSAAAFAETPLPSNAPEETAGAAGAETTPTPAPGEAEDGGADDGSETTDDAQDAGGADSANAPFATLPLWPLLALLGAGLAAGGALLWRRVAGKRRSRAWRQQDTNAGVLAVSRYIMALLRFAGCPEMRALTMPEEYASIAAKALPWIDKNDLAALLTLAQRARFSDRRCTKREREGVIAYAASLTEAVRTHLPRGRRWILWWRFAGEA